jgi:hypothetical protein
MTAGLSAYPVVSLYKKLDLTDPEQLALAILKTLQSK